MFIDIIKFVVAVQIWFERFRFCNIIDFTIVLECDKHNNSKYYYNNNNNNNNNKHTSQYVFQLQRVPLNIYIYTYFSL